VSVFGGFPFSDTPHTGLTVTAVTSGEPAQAQAICTEICEAAMRGRQAFDCTFEPLENSIRRAHALADGPVLLIDHADNCHSGGTQDSMAVIAEALRQGLTGILAGPICDPEAVSILVAAGVGARVTLPIGGKASFAAVGRPNVACTLSGVVRNICDGSFTVTGPLFTGMQVRLGRTVLFETQGMDIVISEGRFEAMDFAMYRILGIDESTYSYIVLKSKVQYKATFGTIARHIVECNGFGVASLDLHSFAFRNLVRPIYPLDGI
jgi:microcystin degradation protein MlrC